MSRKTLSLSAVRDYAFLLALLLLVSFVVFRQYVFGGYCFFSKGVLSDLLRANLPTYYLIYDQISSGHSLWSWRMGLGTSMLSHADAIFDPFTYVAFLGGRDGIPHMMIWIIVTKIIVEGLAFYAFVRRFGIGRFAGYIAAMTYAFSGYSLIMGSNLALGTILVYVPLVFLGIEMWLEGRFPWLLILGLFLTAVYSYYYLYTLAFFSLVYLFIRLRQLGRAIPKVFARFFAIGLLSLLLASFSVFPQVQLLLQSPRVGGSSDASSFGPLFALNYQSLITSLLRTINNDILGSRVTTPFLGYAIGGADYFQNAPYGSILFFPLLAQFLYSEPGKRKLTVVLLAVFVALCTIPLFSFALNACATVNMRWMYILSFAISVLIGFSLQKMVDDRFARPLGFFLGSIATALFIPVSFCILAASDPSHSLSDYVEVSYKADAMLVCELLLIGGLVAIFGKLGTSWRFEKGASVAMAVVCSLLALVMVFDVCFNYRHWYGSEESVSELSQENQTEYDDDSAAIIEDLLLGESNVVRVYKDFDSVVDDSGIPSCNDSMGQAYYGLKCYNSLNNANYISFLQAMGVYVALPSAAQAYVEMGIAPDQVTGSQLNYISGMPERFDLMSFLGVKYYLTRDSNAAIPDYFEYIGCSSGISIYENKRALPIAFCVKETFDASDLMNATSPSDRDAMLMESVVGKTDGLSMLSFSECDFSFQSTIPNGCQVLCFSIPYSSDWEVSIDGESACVFEVNAGLLGAEVSPGNHLVRVVYTPHAFFYGLAVSLIAAICLLALGMRKRIQPFLSKAGS